MVDYYAYLQTVINRGGYELENVEDRINRLWLDGHLTSEQRDQLMQLAADHADESYQVDVTAKLADLDHRVWELEHPVEQYAIWTRGYQTKQHEIVRYDVTGDGEYDLCQYNGGRSYTSLSIGKIDGWHMLDRELNRTHTITRDADGNFVLTPIEPTETEAPAETI